LADYEEKYVIFELIGEWNDAIENDIMSLKREVADKFMSEGIFKFILIAENVLNFHSGDKDYYEEWLEDVEAKGGWIVCINMPEQTQYDFRRAKLDRYIGLMELPDWRIFKPFHLFKRVSAQLEKRLNSSADNGSSEN
jgi:MFS superfamily sulfate permease-like transporter